MNKKINNLIAHQLITKTIYIPKEKIVNYLVDNFNVIEILHLTKDVYDYKEMLKSNNIFLNQSNILINELKDLYASERFLHLLDDEFMKQKDDELIKELNDEFIEQNNI